MPTYGPNSAGAGATVDRGASSDAWTSTSNITASDTNYARNDDPDPYTDYLDATSFGFSIPAGETVVGVFAEIERMEGNAGYNIVDETVQLLDAGSPVGSNKADTVTEWPTAFAYAGYGGAADTWGYGSWTPAKVNASTFGLRVAASGTAAAGAVRVDHIRITVYTTLAVSASEAATLADALAMKMGKALTEAATLTDALAMTTGKVVTDAVSLADAVSTMLIRTVSVTEALSILDALSLKTGKALTDSLSLVDSVALVVTSLWNTVSPIAASWGAVVPSTGDTVSPLRRSLIGLLGLVVFPTPDGVLNADDRRHSAGYPLRVTTPWSWNPVAPAATSWS